MKSTQFVLKTILIIVLLRCHEVFAECNICQSNGVACLNQTSYQFCFGGTTPNRMQTFTCNSGLECTDLPNICFQIGGWTPSCSGVSKCGICNVDNVFACTSLTTFAFCFGSTTKTDVSGICPPEYVCDYSSTEICVPQNKTTAILCNIDGV